MPILKPTVDYSKTMYGEIRGRKYKGKVFGQSVAEFKAELNDCYNGYMNGANWVPGWKEGHSRPFYQLWDVQATPAESYALYRRLGNMILISHDFAVWQEAQIYAPTLPFDLTEVELWQTLLQGFRNDYPTEFAQVEAWFQQVGVTFDIDVTVQ